MEENNKKKGGVRKILGQALGWTCLVIGFFGLFTPFLQGILLILLGVIFLSATYPKLKSWIEKKFENGKTKQPKMRAFLEKTEKIYKKLVWVFEVK